MTRFLLIVIVPAEPAIPDASLADAIIRNLKGGRKRAIIREIEENAQDFIGGNEAINFSQFLIRVRKKYEQFYQTNKITLITY